MIWLDVDADPATFSSSSATLALPPGATVLAARLLWGGTVQPGLFGVKPPDPAGTGSVLLSVPGATAPTTVTAAAVSPDPTAGDRYIASADVTALVAGAGPGMYTAREPAGGHRDRMPSAAGRSRSPTATRPRRCGWSPSPTGWPPSTAAVARRIVIPGLPASAAARAGTVSYAAFEGDFGIVPEQVAVNGAPLVANAATRRTTRSTAPSPRPAPATRPT